PRRAGVKPDPEVEVPVRGLPAKGRDLVHIYIEEARTVGQLDLHEPRLLRQLTGRGDDRIVLTGLEVTTRLQPPSELGVVHEQDRSAIRRSHDRARGEVPGSDGLPGKRIWLGIEE